jgi:RNA polymerase sigma-70 factor (ECF subfamily)
MTDLAATHDRLRPLMFSVAYRMLGSVSEAEDVVQDAFLRMHESVEGGTEITTPEAFATTVTTRLAVDELRSARHRREHYVGPWLPEPLVEDADPARRIEMDETVSMAFLVLLERLSPLERAVFVLREVLDYTYREIAEVLERSEAACRQLYARARRHVDEARPRFEPTGVQQADLSRRFLDAIRDADAKALERLLADDVVFYGDGGGKAPAVRTPLVGAVPVARFLAGLARRGRLLAAQLEPVVANGQPGVAVRDPAGALLGVLGLQIEDGRVVALRNQINPDKLRHLGPVGDLTALSAGPEPADGGPAVSR